MTPERKEEIRKEIEGDDDSFPWNWPELAEELLAALDEQDKALAFIRRRLPDVSREAIKDDGTARTCAQGDEEVLRQREEMR